MKIALAQVNTTVGDFAGNTDKFRLFAQRAEQAGAGLVIFPELALCGYPPRDLVEKPRFLERNRQALETLASNIPGISVLCGYADTAPAGSGKPAANCAALLTQGRVQFVQTKMLLPTYDVFDEGRYFAPALTQELLPLGGQQWAVTICEDIWNDKSFWKKQLYSRDPVEELVQQGATHLLNISASPYVIGKRKFRIDMLRALAIRHRLPVVYVNLVGGNDSLVFDGSSMVLDAHGKICAQAVSFEEDLVCFDTESGIGDIHAQVPEPEYTVYRALVLGTRDYVHKCGFHSALIGLSGGIDSSLVAAIAADALGPENVLGVAMPGPFSSTGSLTDARALASNLGIRFEVLPITETYQSYLRSLAPVFVGLSADTTEENIQARIRGNFLMALSNKFRSLVLSTGNKSELAMGYCTLYGDMAGGLAVISDIPKTMVYRLAALVNRASEIIPRSVIEKPPSAELRPNQKDSDSLPPYEILDAVLKAYIEDEESPEQIAAHAGADLALVRSILARVDGNEYKRQQAPPGLKVTSKAFGIGRRIPIAQCYSQ
ncbi:MAG: NAD+ synthase [Acidobacteria bacterium RIFCSPLOWO2_12_FULL_54_10]|nr:MAG: NAD+ synthase [Acidobacteria bacterium RIFCSPLOWO2_12_FULL_54_10]